MQKLVKQIYLKELIRVSGFDFESWPYVPNHADAVSLLECLIDYTKPVPYMFWIDPKHKYRNK